MEIIALWSYLNFVVYLAQIRRVFPEKIFRNFPQEAIIMNAHLYYNEHAPVLHLTLPMAQYKTCSCLLKRSVGPATRRDILLYLIRSHTLHHTNTIHRDQIVGNFISRHLM